MSSHDNSLEASDSTADLTHAVAAMNLTPPPPAHAAAATAPCLAPTTTSTAAPPAAISTAAGSSRRASTTPAQPTTAPATVQDRSTATVSDPITWEQVQAVKAEHGIGSAEASLIHKRYTDQLAAAGQHDEAISVLRAALKEAMTTLPVNHAGTLEYTHWLAGQLLLDGQYQAALKHYAWLLPKVSGQLGPACSLGCDAMLRVAQCLLNLRQLAEALPAADLAYDLALEVHGRAPEAAWEALTVLLQVHADMGMTVPPAACQHAEQLLQHCKSNHTKEADARACTVGGALVVHYHRCGRDQAVFDLLLHLTAAAKRAYGDSSTEYVTFLRARAIAAYSLKKHSQAISLLQHLVLIHKSQHGEDHPVTIEAAMDLGDAYMGVGRHEDATKVLAVAWASARAVLSSQDELSARVYLAYAAALLGCPGATAWKEQFDVFARQAASWGVMPHATL